MLKHLRGFSTNQPCGVSVSDANSSKSCSKCGNSKPLSLFYQKASARDGRRSECIACTKAHMDATQADRLKKAKLRYIEKRTEAIEYQRKYRSENAETLRAEARDRYHRNSAERRATMSRYREQNAEKCREIARRYRALNKDAVAERDRNKRARRIGAPGRHTANDVRRIYALQRGRCAACRKHLPSSYHVDHITPLARGGTNDAINLQILCPPCNLRKHATDPIEFMQGRGYLL